MPAHQNPIELNNYLNQEVSAGRMSVEDARSRWASNTRIVNESYQRYLDSQKQDYEIRKARYEQAEQERIRDTAYRNRQTDEDKARIAREKEDRLAQEKRNAQIQREENLKANQGIPWSPQSSGSVDKMPSGTGNGSGSNDTISGRNDRTFSPSSGSNSTPSRSGSNPSTPTGRNQSPSPVLTPDRPVTQTPWGGSTEPGGKIVKSGGLPGINQPVNPRGNGTPARPTPNSSNYAPSQPRGLGGNSFGIGAASGIAGELARNDAERERSARERKAIADTQTPEERDRRANDHLEKYRNSFGGPRDYTYPPGYNNTFGNPDFDRLVQDANRHRERNGLGPIGGNGAAGIGGRGLGGGAAGVGGAAGQLGGSANPNWFSPSDPNQPWNAPYNPYKAIDPATGLPWIDRDKMPQMPSYPRPLAPIYQNPDGTPMGTTPDGRPIGPDGVPLWPPGNPNVPPIPGWIPPGPPTSPGIIRGVYRIGAMGTNVPGNYVPGYVTWEGPAGETPQTRVEGDSQSLYMGGQFVSSWGDRGTTIHSQGPGWSIVSFTPTSTEKPEGSPSAPPEPFVPVGRPAAPGANPAGNPLGSPSPSGAPLGSVAPGSSPLGSAAPALAPEGNPAPDRAPGFSPTRPTSPIAPTVPRPSPSPTPNPGRNPQRDPGPQPIGGAAPDPSPSGNPMGGFGSGKSEFRGGSDPSGSPAPTPAPNPAPAPGGSGSTGTGTGSPPRPDCRYPSISSVSVDIFDGFDDKGEAKKKSQTIACLPDAVERVRVTFARLYAIESKKPDGGVAIPEAWAVRRGIDRPQLVIVYAEIFSSGKLGSSRWSLTVPHYRGTAKSKISAPNYKRGNWQGQLTLNDGSTIVVNAASSEECKRSINKLKILVPNDYRITKDGKAIKPRVVENPNLDLKSCNVTAVSAKYYATGQRDMAPTWAKSLRN